MDRYLCDLNLFDKDRVATNKIEYYFEARHYGINEGGYFTKSQAAALQSFKTPNGLSLINLIKSTNTDRGQEGTGNICVKHFLAPILERVFFPNPIPPPPKTSSPLWTVEETQGPENPEANDVSNAEDTQERGVAGVMKEIGKGDKDLRSKM